MKGSHACPGSLPKDWVLAAGLYLVAGQLATSRRSVAKEWGSDRSTQAFSMVGTRPATRTATMRSPDAEAADLMPDVPGGMEKLVHWERPNV